MIIDVTRLVGRLLSGRLPTGIDRVDIEYIRRYQTQSSALIRYRGKWIFFSPNHSKSIFSALINHDIRAQWKIRAYVFLSYINFFSPVDTRGQCLLNISHSGLDDQDYVKNIERFQLEPIYFIHDLIPIDYPQFSRTGEPQRHGRRLETVLTSARAIIVNSDDTYHGLERYSKQQGYRFPQCVVAHLGLTPLVYRESTVFTHHPYFVILGTIEGRKNHLLLLNIWRDMVKELGEKTPHLVLIGQRGWKAESVFEILDHCDILSPYVIEKSHCSDQELSGWLYHAQALLFPSFCEGYGMPLAEALSIGIPVIASDLAVFREIAGDIPHYINPLDRAGWREMISEYALEDSPKRQEQLLRMKSYVPVQWEDHFSIVDPLIEGRDFL